MNATVDGLATPTSVLVSEAAPQTPEWYAQRRAGITATDLVKAMGLSSYGDAYTVWLDKRDELADDAGEAAYWGTIHEPAVANRWADLAGVNLRPIGTVARVDHPHHLASLDRLVLPCPDGEGPCGLEVKSRSAFLQGNWREDVPDAEYVQVLWQMWVTGYRHMHLAVLFGGNHLRSYRVEWDDDDIARLIQHADDLWQHVTDGTRPDVNHDGRLLDVLKRLYPTREGQAEIAEDDARALIAAWHQAKRAKSTADAGAKRAKAALEAATAALVDRLGPAERAFIEGDPQPAYEYRERNRAGYVVNPATWRELRVNAAYLPAAPASEIDLLGEIA